MASIFPEILIKDKHAAGEIRTPDHRSADLFSVINKESTEAIGSIAILRSGQQFQST